MAGRDAVNQVPAKLTPPPVASDMGPGPPGNVLAKANVSGQPPADTPEAHRAVHSTSPASRRLPRQVAIYHHAETSRHKEAQDIGHLFACVAGGPGAGEHPPWRRAPEPPRCRRHRTRTTG